MKYLFLFLLFLNFSYAHKINLFITNENDDLQIYSYFASSMACKNCKLIIKNEEKIVLQDVLNSEGKYTYKPTFKNVEIIVDASSGHIVSEKIEVSNIKNEKLNQHLKKEEDKKYLNILIGLILLFLIFSLLKRFKK